MMKNYPPMIAAAAALLSPLASQAAVLVNTSGTTSSQIWTIGKTAGIPTVTGANLVSGSFTGGGANDSFQVTVRGANNWDPTAAQAAITGNTFNIYLTGLTNNNLGRLAAGAFGVGDSNLNAAGEVITFTFGGYSLSPGTSVDLTSISWGLLTAADRLDYVLYRGSTNNIIASAFNSTLTIGAPYTDIQAGDSLTVAFRASDFRINNIGFDIIPEPSCSALVMGALGLGLLRRNRRCA